MQAKISLSLLFLLWHTSIYIILSINPQATNPQNVNFNAEYASIQVKLKHLHCYVK